MLSEAIESVVAQTITDWELLIVDDGSEIPAGPVDHPRISVLRLPGSLGPAAARNEGASRATGDVLVFVDADVVVHPEGIGRIRRAFDSEPELAALFGSYDDDPFDPGIVSAFRNLLHHHVHTSAAGPASTFWAGLGAIRREAFDEAGGFDAARYPQPSVEDIDLGLRVSAAGGLIRLDPSVRGTHLKAWTLLDMLEADFAVAHKYRSTAGRAAFRYPNVSAGVACGFMSNWQSVPNGVPARV